MYKNIANYIAKHDRIGRHMSRSTSDIYINHPYREFIFQKEKSLQKIKWI